jgi:predicted nucleic-acid-binding protein
MRAVDTNVLVRLMTRDDVKQVSVAEATWVLASVYDRSPEAVATAVEMLLSHEHLTVQDTEVVATAVAQFRQCPRVGFSDCLMVEVARKAGHVPLGTFDRDLGKLDGAQRL